MAFNYLQNVALVKKVGNQVFVVDDPFLVQDIIANREDLIAAADIATEVAENAAQDAAEIKESLKDVQGVFDENKKLILLTDGYLLQLLNVASSASRHFTERDIKAYHQWYKDGLDLLRRVSTVSLHSSEETKTDIEHFLGWFREEKETALLSSLSLTAEKTKQEINNAITHYDDDIRTRNLLIRIYVEKPPILFIVAGQSNAMGQGGYPSIEVADWAGTYWDWEDQKNKLLKPLRDPVYRCKQKSAWPAFGKEFFAITGRKVCILNVAMGGSYVTDYGGTNTWYGEDSILRQQATTEYQAVTEALGTQDNDWVLGGMLWIQGEAETYGVAMGTVTIQQYKTGTLDVFNFFRTLTAMPTMPIYMSQIGYQVNRMDNEQRMRGFHAIQNAQIELSQQNQNVHLVFAGAKYFARAGMMADQVHYDRKGYSEVGKAFARFISNNQSFKYGEINHAAYHRPNCSLADNN